MEYKTTSLLGISNSEYRKATFVASTLVNGVASSTWLNLSNAPDYMGAFLEYDPEGVACEDLVTVHEGQVWLHESAPPPKQTHKLLKKLGLNHVLYTSHSHSEELNCHRIILSCYRPNKVHSRKDKCTQLVIGRWS